ncbi:MAG TPA: hypothetical protein VD948_02910 [Rhodothermales bacterium]|nr:hypothetical protein [Rhodothermales bacterium]
MNGNGNNGNDILALIELGKVIASDVRTIDTRLAALATIVEAGFSRVTSHLDIAAKRSENLEARVMTLEAQVAELMKRLA